VQHAFPGGRVMFVPEATVRHFVHEDRLTFKYFTRRCFVVSRGKVGAFKGMGAAGNLAAEKQFVWRAITRATRDEAGNLWRGDLAAPARVAVLILGIALAGAGYGVGTLEARLQRGSGN
jgi:glucosyl-dolichyl phosphate glucuronosyltransferase